MRTRTRTWRMHQLSATWVSISMQDQVPSWLEQFSNIFSPQLTDLEDYAEVKTYIGIVWLKKHILNNFHRKSLPPWMLKLNSCMLHCDQKLLSMDFDREWQHGKQINAGADCYFLLPLLLLLLLVLLSIGLLVNVCKHVGNELKRPLRSKQVSQLTHIWGVHETASFADDVWCLKENSGVFEMHFVPDEPEQLPHVTGMYPALKWGIKRR